MTPLSEPLRGYRLLNAPVLTEDAPTWRHMRITFATRPFIARSITEELDDRIDPDQRRADR